MKKMVAVCLLIVICLGVTACGSSKNSETSKKAGNQFTFATWAAGKELEEFKEIIKRVNEKAAGKYVIEIQSIPSDYYVKISTQIAGKRSPDFFWMTQELISKYADLGAIADLTDAFGASESLKPEQYYEGVLASAAYKDRYWGLPWIANPLMVYYNKTMFEQLGIPCPSPADPWTWEEFIETARKLTGQKNYKGEDVYGYIVDGWPNIETFIWAGGGDIIGEDGTTIELDSPESIKGMGYLHTIISEGLTPKYAEVASLGSNNVWFEKQRTAMFTGGLQDNFEEKVGKLEEAAQFEIGYAPMPVCDDGTAWTFDWTASTVMAKSLEGNALAYQALEDVTKEFFSWKIASPIKDSVEEILQVAPLKEHALETAAYTLENARSANYGPEWSDINNKLWYDLYVKILSDPNFDYAGEMKKIAEYSRGLMANRK